MKKTITLLLLLVSQYITAQLPISEQYESFVFTLLKSLKTNNVNLYKTICASPEEYQGFADEVQRRIQNPYSYAQSGLSPYYKGYDDFVRKESAPSYQSYLNKATDRFYKLMSLKNKENIDWQNIQLKGIYLEGDDEIQVILKSFDKYFSIEIEAFHMGSWKSKSGKKLRISDGFDGYHIIRNKKEFEAGFIGAREDVLQSHERILKNAKIESEKYFLIDYNQGNNEIVENTQQVNSISTTTANKPIQVSLLNQKPSLNKCSKVFCFGEEIKKKILASIPQDKYQDLGVTGKSRIMLSFVIETDGSITNIKTLRASEELSKTISQTLTSIKSIQAGIKDNKRVRTRFSMPLIF